MPLLQFGVGFRRHQCTLCNGFLDEKLWVAHLLKNLSDLHWNAVNKWMAWPHTYCSFSLTSECAAAPLLHRRVPHTYGVLPNLVLKFWHLLYYSKIYGESTRSVLVHMTHMNFHCNQSSIWLDAKTTQRLSLSNQLHSLINRNAKWYE
jgi:hypothetical protein